MIKCNHSPLQKFVYSIMKNDKVKNWSQEIHANNPTYRIPTYKRKR